MYELGARVWFEWAQELGFDTEVKNEGMVFMDDGLRIQGPKP